MNENPTDTQTVYDVIIIGAGPAGLSAAISAGRARLHTLLIEKDCDGGQITLTDDVENYPGGIAGESGGALSARMFEQAERFGATRVFDTITKVELSGDVKTLTGLSAQYRAKAVIAATGAAPRRLSCPGEDEFIGKGVSFCATCDGALFRDMEVFVAGGGDTAVEEAVFLTRFARQVTLVHRRDALRAAECIREQAQSNPKIRFIWDSVISDLAGDVLLSRVTVKNIRTSETTVFHADPNDGAFGVFIFVGRMPNTRLFEGLLDMEDGYVLTDADMKTNIPGVFAAGDIRKKSLRQVVTAAADGAIAAAQADRYLRLT